MARSMRGESADWGLPEEIGAATFDAIQRLTHYFLQANGAKSSKEPTPFPRPGSWAPPPEARTQTDLKGLANFLEV